MDENGDFIVVWKNNRHFGNGEIYGQKYDKNGSPAGSNFVIADSTGQLQVSPDISIRNNRFVVVWADLRSGSAQIYTRIFNTDGSPVSSEFRIIEYDGDTTLADRFPQAFISTAWKRLIL